MPRKPSTPPILADLTTENANRVAVVINKANPDWGTKRFNYNEQPLTEGRRCSTVGAGSNSAVLFEGEYHFWGVTAYHDEPRQ